MRDKSIINLFTTVQNLLKSLFYYEYYIQQLCVMSRAWLASSVYLRLCCLHQWGSMGVWHRHNAVSSNCDCDVMWVAIPMHSALFAPPPLQPLCCPTAAHRTVTSGHPLWGTEGRGWRHRLEETGAKSQIFWLEGQTTSTDSRLAVQRATRLSDKWLVLVWMSVL